ncbi:MAG: hypothetical protein NZ522_01130, partial [Chitinophagales bacterium]|nr:hypothetical protein [Chitinophagales bacterium]
MIFLQEREMTSSNLFIRTLFFIILCAFIFLSSACKEDYPYPSGKGKKPVYISYDSLLKIRGLPPQPVQKTGTIFLLDTLFFLLEQK